ncbi:MAG: SDR family oxidoreductase [Anaerolineaceae bacterium]|nr:SDR family oxidoreductase [Anaerolineaceae bacterium]
MIAEYYRGKSALITGGSSGIGLALATELAGFCAKVTLLARNPEKLQVSRAAIIQQHPQAQVGTISADVTDADALSELLENYVRVHGTPDILINSAGVARPGYVEEIPLDVFRWTMDIDYHGTVNTVKLLIPGMLERGSGHIINVSSLAGVLGVYGYTAYSGAKFAVKGFSDTLRAELKPRGIRVSVIFPPDTDTPQLRWENQFKPKETSSISGGTKPISAEFVARETLKAASKGKYAIVPGFEAKLTYFAATRLGNWVYPIMDLLVRKAIKNKK